MCSLRPRSMPEPLTAARATTQALTAARWMRPQTAVGWSMPTPTTPGALTFVDGILGSSAWCSPAAAFSTTSIRPRRARSRSSTWRAATRPTTPTNAHIWASAAGSVFNHLYARARHSSGLYYADLVTSADPGHDALASVIAPNDALLTETQTSVAVSLLRAQGIIQNANLVMPSSRQFPFVAPGRLAAERAPRGPGRRRDRALALGSDADREHDRRLRSRPPRRRLGLRWERLLRPLPPLDDRGRQQLEDHPRQRARLRRRPPVARPSRDRREHRLRAAHGPLHESDQGQNGTEPELPHAGRSIRAPTRPPSRRPRASSGEPELHRAGERLRH